MNIHMQKKSVKIVLIVLALAILLAACGKTQPQTGSIQSPVSAPESRGPSGPPQISEPTSPPPR